MKLSVYIPALTRDALFDRCMRSVRRSIAAAGREGLPEGEYEICVVEGVSPLAAARNAGIERTAGEWIATVDSDDEVTESWFAEICQAIARAEKSERPVDDIVFDMVQVMDGREMTCVLGRPPVIAGRTLRDDVLRNIRIGCYTCLHVMRRRVFGGIRYDRVPVLEDYVTMPRLLQNVRWAMYVAQPLYRYVIRKGSLSNGVDRLTLLEIASRRFRALGRPSEVSVCLLAYDCLYERSTASAKARRLIRRHLLSVLADGEVPIKWKVKFLLAAVGVMVRRPVVRSEGPR